MKLSIAIPTYNGAKYIRETLDSIISQLNDIDEKIEIVISDNASTDETPQIIKEYQEKYPGLLSYYRNEENFGPDRNIDLAVKRSKGEYVWLFSDDDIMLSDGIKHILSVLNIHKNIAAIFVNWRAGSYDLKKIEHAHLRLTKDILFTESDKFLETVKLNPIFLSSNIVNRNLWNMVDNSNFIGTNWLQYGALLSLINKRKVYCISRPFVIYRYNNERWDKMSVESIYMSIRLSYIIDSFLPLGYKKSTLRKLNFVIVKNLPYYLYNLHKKNIKITYNIKKDLFNCYKDYIFFVLFVMPLLILPRAAIIFFGKIIKVIKSIKL